MAAPVPDQPTPLPQGEMRTYLETRKAELLAEIQRYIFDKDTGYRALATQKNYGQLGQKAAILQSAYEELAEVTSSLGQTTLSENAQRRADIFALENDSEKLKEGIADLEATFQTRIGTLASTLQNADPKDDTRHEEYASTIHQMRSEIAMAQHLLNIGGRDQDLSPEAKNVAKNLNELERMVEVKAALFHTPFELENAAPLLPTWELTPLPTASPQAETVSSRIEAGLSSLQSSAVADDTTSASIASLQRDVAELKRIASQPGAPVYLSQRVSRLEGAIAAETSRLEGFTTATSNVSMPPATSSHIGNLSRDAAAAVLGGAQILGGAPLPGVGAAPAQATTQTNAPNAAGATPETPLHFPGRSIHRRTGIPKLDSAIVAEPEYISTHYGQPPHGSLYRGDFLIRKSKSNRYYLSPTGDEDSQEVEIFIDPDDPKATSIKDFIAKNQGWVCDITLLKKRDENNRPIFVIANAEPWKDADASVKTAVWDSKSKSMVAKTIKYDKYTLIALNIRYRLLAELLVQSTRKELLGLDAPKTQTLLKHAGTLAAFSKNLKASNLESDYDTAIAGIASRKDNAWIEAKYQAWSAANNGRAPTSLSAPERQEIIRSAVLEEVFNERTQGRTYAELIEGKLPISITYTDSATGQQVTTDRLQQNLMFADDQQRLPPEVLAALRANPQAYLAWALNRAIMRSVSHHAAKVSSHIDRITGERISVLADAKSEAFKTGAVNFITKENENLVRRGYLFEPRYSKEDPAVPGLKEKEGALTHAVEFFGQDADRAFTKDAIRMGAKVFNPEFVDDDISRKVNQALANTQDPSQLNLQERIDVALQAIDIRSQRVENVELSANTANLINAINGVRHENGLPSIGRLPPEDWKATIGVMEIITGNILKEIFGMWTDAEKSMGFF